MPYDMFTRRNQALLRRLGGNGNNCTATLNGQVCNFPGIFKTQNVIKVEGGLEAITDQNVVDVDTLSVGNYLKENQPITVNGLAFVCSEIKQIDDGSFTRVVLLPTGQT